MARLRRPRPRPAPAPPAIGGRRPMLALPAPPGYPRAREPAHPLCTLCGGRHPRLAPLPPYERVLTPWASPGRPEPLGRQAIVIPTRSAMRPWR
jgi:hypothetical protein